VSRVAELVTLARNIGVPAPAYQDVVPLLDGGVVVLQELVSGMRPRVCREVVAALIDFSERRRGVLSGTRFATTPTPLYLTADGPGFCLHGPLRDRDSRTRRLLEWVEAIGHATSDVVEGDDLVHFDYHLGNALAHSDDDRSVVAILDWDGAANGDIAIDGVILALDLVLYDADPKVVDPLVDHLQQTTSEDTLRACWAHGLLRLVDWRLRHSPDDDLSWLSRAEKLANVE
jgi:hypothetical protein